MAVCPFPVRIKNPKPSFLYPGPFLDVPCGKCSVCEYNRKREWTIRLLHESRASHATFFVTLTYDDENLPLCPECGLPYLCKEDAKDFTLNAKKFFDFLGFDFRYFIVGEYGETYGRPHFHLLVFLTERNALKLDFSLNVKEFQKIIGIIWKYGFVHIGSASDGASAYCAKYCLKNMASTTNRCPHVNGYLSSSRKPIIGYTYFQKIESHYLSNPQDQVLRLNGYSYGLPRSYRKQLIKNDELYKFASHYFRAKFANEKSRENPYGIDGNGLPLSDGGFGQRKETERYYRRRMFKRGSDRQ